MDVDTQGLALTPHLIENELAPTSQRFVNIINLALEENIKRNSPSSGGSNPNRDTSEESGHKEKSSSGKDKDKEKEKDKEKKKASSSPPASPRDSEEGYSDQISEFRFDFRSQLHLTPIFVSFVSYLCLRFDFHFVFHLPLPPYVAHLASSV